MRIFAAGLRLIIALSVVIAVTATFFDTASRTAINPFNFFGFFTLQSNILTAGVLVLASIAGTSARKSAPALELARACVTTYMIIVGIVYNTLLVGLPGGVELAWANTILHVVVPIYVLLDWVLFADRGPVAWKRFWVVLVYPLVWLAVVLVRGATDGWVPYPFLNPQLGYGVVSLYVIGIAVGIAIFGAIVWAISRARVLNVTDDRSAS